jgi:tight adherence protein C
MYDGLMDYVIPAAIFVLVASGFFSLVYRLLEERRGRRRLRADELVPDTIDARPNLILGNLTPALAAQIPLTAGDRDDLQKELKTAGYYGATALLDYAAVRTVLVVVPLIAAGLLALLVEEDEMVKVLVGGAVAAGLGYSIPRIYLFLRGRARTRQLENALPVAVDMLTLCMSAGQTLIASLGRVATELAPAHPLMAAELAITRRHAEIGNLSHALKQLAERIPVGEVRNLALILSQAERLGSETGPALLEFSNNLRTTLKQRADNRANQTMFWMLFPTITCLWIPAAILLVGPAVLEFRTQRQTIFKEWRESRDKLRNLNQPQTTAPATPESEQPRSPGQ